MYYAVKITPHFLQLHALTPSADSVCPGDTVMFTCVTDTGKLLWIVNNSVWHVTPLTMQIMTEQIFKFLLVNVTGIDNKHICLQLLHTMCYLVIMDRNSQHCLFGWWWPDQHYCDFVCANRWETCPQIFQYTHVSHNYNHVQHHLHLHPSTWPSPHSVAHLSLSAG